MLGVFVNVLAVVVGGALGLALKKGFPKKLADAVMSAIALCILAIAVSGILEGENILVSIISMVLGTVVGTILDLDRQLKRLGAFVEKKLGGGDGSLAQGFVTASLLFCVGAMTVVGSIQSGLSGDHRIAFTKSTLDFVSSIMLSSAMGLGVMLSGATILVVQGGIVVLAGVLSPVLTDFAIAEMTCCGSLMIFGMGLNMLGITKLKVANFLPALVFAPVVCWASQWLSGLNLFEFLG